MERILVTGGAGFIGSHLCKRLLNNGNKVICLDNFFTGVKSNVEKLLANPNFELVEHDITQPFDADVTQIYNLACPASQPHYQFNPIKTLKTSVLGMMNVLELAHKYNAKVLQASTSEIYGDPQIHPQVESYWGNVNPIGIRSCYDEGKRIAETLAMNYRVQNNVNTKIVRIFNTYGPRMLFNDGRVVSNFIVQALKGEDITIYGDGTQTRSFCFVEDLIQGFVKMIAKKDFFGPCNLGNPTELNMKELATKIITLTNSKSKIVYRPLPQDDPKRRKPDITLAKEKLNWEPKISVDEGLKRTIEDFDKRLRENL